LNPSAEKLFHLAWDVDRVPYRFHKKFLPRFIAFGKKLISILAPLQLPFTGNYLTS
jgi:hypothetical protein